MELKVLKCPGCGGALELEDGLDTFFCKYCGYKIVLSGQSDAAYKAKTVAKKLEHKKQAQERMYQNDHDKWERNEISKEREFKRSTKGWIIGLIIFFGVIISVFLPLYLLTVPHTLRVNELKKIEKQIEEDIDDGDYEHAILLTNKLRLKDNWSTGESEEWEERRQEYVRIIRKAQEKEGDFDFIDAPFDSDDCSDYTKSEMVDLLSEAGFENIDTEKVKGSAGFFSSKHTVEHVTIDGESEFTKKDSFIETADIVIYYYEK